MDIKSYLKRMDKWYPPSKYLFYPTYKFIRRKTNNIYLSYMATWSLSRALHSIPLPNEDGESYNIGLMFIGLGVIGATAKYIVKCRNLENQKHDAPPRTKVRGLNRRSCFGCSRNNLGLKAKVFCQVP